MGALCASVRLVSTRGSGRDSLLDSLVDLPVDSLLERCSLDHRAMFQTSPVRCRFTALSLISKLEFLIARAAVSQTFRKRFGKRLGKGACSAAFLSTIRIIISCSFARFYIILISSYLFISLRAVSHTDLRFHILISVRSVFHIPILF